MLSPETLELFIQLLNSYSLPATHPQFDLIASRISRARVELSELIPVEDVAKDEPTEEAEKS